MTIGEVVTYIVGCLDARAAVRSMPDIVANGAQLHVQWLGPGHPLTAPAAQHFDAVGFQ
jgi:hypothetical protein